MTVNRVRLVVPTSVLLLLVLLAYGMFQHKQRENARRDGMTMRAVVNQYTLGQHRPPRSLADLIAAGYLEHEAVGDKHLQELFLEATEGR